MKSRMFNVLASSAATIVLIGRNQNNPPAARQKRQPRRRLRCPRQLRARQDRQGSLPRQGRRDVKDRPGLHRPLESVE
jgi:hypothetical protein